MLKRLLFFALLLSISCTQAQEIESLYKTKTLAVAKDSLTIEAFSINPTYFLLLDQQQQEIDSSLYKVNFIKGKLQLAPSFFESKRDSITIKYLQYPDFLTKKYQIYDASSVVEADISNLPMYKIAPSNVAKAVPFDGLNTSGSITRGVTVGTNQNAVLNSNLDLQITGKISDKVSLRASLQDSNIPIQNGGYSQKLDQFDNIFMELFSDNWNIRAGDIFLENHKTQFLNFNKKVQGLAANFDFGTDEKKTNVFASASLVKGQYAKSNFNGIEGNQGPYKLKGQNGELYVLVISGSERVYVNGRQLKRGENNDYTIDYNAGEITFTALFTITSEMRIAVEYQYTDRNYTRFVTYAGASHEEEKWSLAGYLYSENDAKNQPVQQNLSTEQVQILAQAGDNTTLMSAPSAYVDSYSENKTLYEQKTVNGTLYYEYSTDKNATLHSVNFTLVGNNLGDYTLLNSSSISKIYNYVPPINGIPQGNYAPITLLVPPTKVQVATFLGKYSPSEKTAIDFEIALSNNDKNLFSNLDDSNNQGISTKINARQRLFSKQWNIDAFGKYQFIQKNFSSVERLYTIEFDRDWNIEGTVSGDQSLLTTGLHFSLNPIRKTKSKGDFIYQFEKLDFSGAFSGNRHLINGLLQLNHWNFSTQGSYLKSEAITSKSTFLRNQAQVRYHFGKNWIGGSNRIEDNQSRDKVTNAFAALSQRFTEYGAFVGRGDSTKVYVQLGLLKRSNDSIQNGLLQRVNKSNSYFLKSRLIQSNTSDLTIYTNYRVLDYTNPAIKKESTLNSRAIFNDRFFNQLLLSTTTYETNSGSLPQQEYTFLEVDAGQGVYMWNDYNGNGLQELQEFEIAPYIDQAKYIQVYLPNLVYIKTHQTKFSQSLIFNPSQWQNKTGFKKLASYFYNQTNFLIDRKTKNNGANFELNPFSTGSENVLGLSSSFRNSLFYNRGKQNHSITYTYLDNKAKNLLSNGTQETTNSSHQLQYAHLYKKSWLLGFFTKTIATSVNSENYPLKNYSVSGYQLAPKLSYLFSKNTSWDIFYELQNKNNQIGALETLLQNRFGTSFSYSGKKNITLNGEVSFYQNKYNGDAFSSVGFQMLEGLQTGQNTVWKLLLQKNITQFLDINLNYLGRKSETSATVHTGNIQLRAYF
ncbi:hypothetical protein FFWV33_06155 [Flavobacterium faecale]|uniref:Uncharacterized protein n=1 Tax=Flavobacterium faecale TaxID=1355330 RepID=A0A2S1LBP9_9FLAO|nr:hypothetical protein [Flavobacterium faecale]AWG21144.1 hypothetical protein FFWV33_06155 [Flavobacterium faecale]